MALTSRCLLLGIVLVAGVAAPVTAQGTTPQGILLLGTITGCGPAYTATGGALINPSGILEGAGANLPGIAGFIYVAENTGSVSWCENVPDLDNGMVVTINSWSCSAGSGSLDMTAQTIHGTMRFVGSGPAVCLGATPEGICPPVCVDQASGPKPVFTAEPVEGEPAPHNCETAIGGPLPTQVCAAIYPYGGQATNNDWCTGRMNTGQACLFIYGYVTGYVDGPGAPLAQGEVRGQLDDLLNKECDFAQGTMQCGGNLQQTGGCLGSSPWPNESHCHGHDPCVSVDHFGWSRTEASLLSVPLTPGEAHVNLLLTWVNCS